MTRKSSIAFIFQLYRNIKDHEITTLAAQSAYYLLLAIFPFLMFVIALIGYSPISQKDFLEQFLQWVPNDIYEVIISILNQVIMETNSSILSFGIIVALWSSSRGVASIMHGLNKAYNKKESRSFFMTRGVSFIFTLLIAFSMFFSFVAVIFGKIIGENIFALLRIETIFEKIWNILRFSLSFSILVVIFTFLYTYLPNHRPNIKKSIPGALFTTLSWNLLSMLFSYYVNHFGSYRKIYGSIGGVMALLIWLYFSSLLILIGGEINFLLAHGKIQLPRGLHQKKENTP